MRVVSLTFRVSSLVLTLGFLLAASRLVRDMANPQGVKGGTYFIFSLSFAVLQEGVACFGLVEWLIVVCVCVGMPVVIRHGMKMQPSAVCLNILHSRYTQG